MRSCSESTFSLSLSLLFSRYFLYLIYLLYTNSNRYGYKATAKQRFDLFSEGIVAIEVIPSTKNKNSTLKSQLTKEDRQAAAMSMRIESIASSVQHSPSGRHIRLRVNTQNSGVLLGTAQNPSPGGISESVRKLSVEESIFPPPGIPPGLSESVREKAGISSARRRTSSGRRGSIEEILSATRRRTSSGRSKRHSNESVVLRIN